MILWGISRCVAMTWSCCCIYRCFTVTWITLVLLVLLHLAEGHLDTDSGGAGEPTRKLLITRQPARTPESNPPEYKERLTHLKVRKLFKWRHGLPVLLASLTAGAEVSYWTFRVHDRRQWMDHSNNWAIRASSHPRSLTPWDHQMPSTFPSSPLGWIAHEVFITVRWSSH